MAEGENQTIMTTYRKARHADVNAITAIMNENLDEYRQYREYEANHNLPEKFTDMYVGQYLEIEDAPIFVAETPTEDGPAISGCIIALCESMLNPDLDQSEHLHITNLDVRSEFRRQGIGRALVLAVEDWARKRQFTAIFTEVYSQNKNAVALFDPDGYATVKESRRKLL